MISEIIEEIANKSDQYFEFKGKPFIEKLRTHHYNNSEITILRLYLGKDEKRVYVKRYVVTEFNKVHVKQRTITEFDILNYLYHAFKPYPKLSVARPIAAFPEYHTLVTEECPGTTLQKLLGKKAKVFSPAKNIEILRNYCYLVGRWLNLFHTFTKRPNERFNIDDLVEYCDIRLKLLMDHPESGIDSGFRKKVINYLERGAQLVAVEDNFVAGRHNDYLPLNIIVNGEKVSVLDFTMFDYNSIYYDLCSFWHSLESLKVGPFYRSETVAKLQESFFAGYGRGVDISSPVFKIIQVRRKVTKMLELISSKSYLIPRRFMDAKQYKNYLDWLVKECHGF